MPRWKKYRCQKCGEERERHCNAKLCSCGGRLVEIGKDDRCCPTCGKPWKPEHIRICANCRKVIASGHKWMYVQRKGLTTLIHRNCESPKDYRKETT